MDRKKENEGIIVDQEVIATKILHAPELGRKTGLENLPSSTAVLPGDDEKHFKRFHEQLLGNNHELWDRNLGESDQRQLEIIATLDPENLEETRDEARRKALEAKTKMEKEMKTASQHRDRHKRRLAALRDQGIDASSDGVGTYLLMYAALVAFIIVESLLNAYFLGQGSDLGLVGGAIMAFFISALSIVLSFTAGVWIRAIYERNKIRRVLSVLSGLVFLTAMTGYHVLIGWYRASLVYGNTQTAAADALANFAEYRLALPDIYCFALVVIGVFFAGTAIIAGFKRKEARQAALYARVARDFELAEEVLRDIERSYYDDINRAYMEQIAEIERLEKRAGELSNQFHLNFLQMRKIVNSYRSTAKAIHNSYEYVIGCYRRSNEAVRNIPSPEYFREDPQPLDDDAFQLDQDPFEKAKTFVNELTKHMKKYRDAAKKARKDIRVDYERILKETPMIIMSYHVKHDTYKASDENGFEDPSSLGQNREVPLQVVPRESEVLYAQQ